MVWAAILRRRTLPPAWGSKHDVHLLLPLLSTHTTTNPPPSRNHSADLSRTSPLATHWIPLATLARENQWLPTLSSTPELKSTKTTSGGGISLPQATHALSPVVSRQINSLPLDRGTRRPSHQKPKCNFEISRPTRQRLGTSFQGITPSDESSGLKGTTWYWTSPMDSRTEETDPRNHSAR